MKVKFVKDPNNSVKPSSRPVLHGDDPNKATVEAEKGETVLTTSGNVGNQKELANIGGKKHSEGGTFLDLPAGSAIFSDHLKLADEKMLGLFGYKGKKARTFAEISKQYNISELNDKLADPDTNIDKIAKTSLEKSITDANYKLSLLFTLQQFHEEKKGEQDDHSRHFEPFLERTRLGYDELLNSDSITEAPTDQQEDKPMAFGGQSRGFMKNVLNQALDYNQTGQGPQIIGMQANRKGLFRKNYDIQFAPIQEEPMIGSSSYAGSVPDATPTETTPAAPTKSVPRFVENGAETEAKINAPKEGERWGEDDSPYTPQQAYGKEGATQLNEILKVLGLGEIEVVKDKTDYRKEVKQSIRDVQIIGSKNPKIIADYFLNRDNNATKSHRPNNQLQRMLKEAKLVPSNGKEFTNADLRKFYDEGEINDAFIVKGFNDGLWHYRAPYTKIYDIEDGDEYQKLDSEVKQKGFQASDGNWYIFRGQGKYEGYRYKADGSIEAITPDPKIMDELYKWNVKNMPDEGPAPIDMQYRWENRRALAQAKKNRRNIPFITPFTAMPETYYTDMAYYSPDQAIGALQSMSSTRGEQQAMFASPQTQLANQLADQEYLKMNSIISEYADKNVASYNAERNMNTNIAQNSSNRLAAAMQGNADKWAILKQQYRTAASNADNAVAMQEIAMHKERADRLNSEAAIGEQFKTDPNTGVQMFVKGKDYFPDTSNTADIASTFESLRTELPSASDDVIAKMALAMHSEKYKVSGAGSTEYDPDNYLG